MAWTPAGLITAERLWGEGMSASLIAEAVGGITRNAVIGMVGRKKWGRHSQNRTVRQYSADRPRGRPPKLRDPARLLNRSNSNPTGFRGVKPRKPRAARRTTIRPEVPMPPNVRMIGILDLDETTCKFPIGDPRQPDFGFCGADKMFLDSYCGYHMRLAYQPPSERSRPSRSIGWQR